MKVVQLIKLSAIALVISAAPVQMAFADEPSEQSDGQRMEQREGGNNSAAEETR